jgi:hypothetical protein
MPTKKPSLNTNEIPIYDEAIIYLRGDYWQMRMWLANKKIRKIQLKNKK